MKKITLHVRTNNVNSRVETSFEVEESDLAGLDEHDISSWLFEQLCDSGLFEWGYEIE